MRDYSYTEIGMLSGAALGGLLAAIGFSATGKTIYLLVSIIAIALGVAAGSYMDRRTATVKNSIQLANDNEIYRSRSNEERN